MTVNRSPRLRLGDRNGFLGRVDDPRPVLHAARHVLSRKVYRRNGLMIANAPTTEAADALLTKLAPKSGAADALLRFGEAVGLTREDFAPAEPLAPCLALTAQFYSNVVCMLPGLP